MSGEFDPDTAFRLDGEARAVAGGQVDIGRAIALAAARACQMRNTR